MNTTKIKILAPATIANLVCGFDVLGLAITQPQDEMWMSLNQTGQINITHTDAYNLPTEPEKNVAGAALIALQKSLENKNIGFEVTINKIIKPGSGLGSSAASAAGAIVGANYLLGNIFTQQEQVHYATYGEAVASGAMHADNIAPCIYGGVTLIRSMQPLDIIAIAPPPLFVTVIHPQIEIKTSEARKILPTQIPLKTAVTQWGNVAGLIAGLLQGNYDLIGRSLVDVVAEPVRSALIPGFNEVKNACIQAGALGGGISGSGPSVFMLSQTQQIAEQVEQAMIAVYKNLDFEFYTYVTTVNNKGVQIFEV